jgi:hypothetical protein
VIDAASSVAPRGMMTIVVKATKHNQSIGM